MARPHKDNAEYHSHDKDMRNDPKIRALRRKYGHEGYSIFNMLLEVLTGSRNFELDWNPTSIILLEGDFDTDKLEEIVKFCVETLNLFTIENGKLFSYRHIERFSGLLSRRERQRNGVIYDDNTQSKVKESKGKKEKKEKKEKRVCGLVADLEAGMVYFDCDKTEGQELGPEQKRMLQNREIAPWGIEKGVIY